MKFKLNSTTHAYNQTQHKLLFCDKENRACVSFECISKININTKYLHKSNFSTNHIFSFELSINSNGERSGITCRTWVVKKNEIMEYKVNQVVIK